MYEDTIKILKELARSNQEQFKEIGFAIGLVNFCMRNKISSKDNAFELPMASDAFGYFTVQECTENGDLINTVSDENGMTVEVIPEAFIIAASVKASVWDKSFWLMLDSEALITPTEYPTYSWKEK